MSWFVQFRLFQMVIAVVFAGVFSYLYWHDRRPCLRAWSRSWIAWSCMFIVELAIHKNFGPRFLLIAADRLSLLLSGMLLVIGLFRFVNRAFPASWYALAAGACTFSLLATYADLSLTIQLAPVFFFIGYIYICSGIILLSPEQKGTSGRHPIGWAFYIWGMHLADFPLLAQIEAFLPWGELIALMLAIITANGILIAYYQRIREELVASEALLRLLADNAQDVIYRQRYWPELRLDYISPSVTKLTGYKQAELYADHELVKKMIHPDDLPYLNNNLPTEQTNVKTRWVHRDGTVHYMDMNVAPVFGADGIFVAIEGIARDITDRVKAEEEVVRMQEARERLLSNISHDLRTPMTSIQGYLEALLDGVITEPADRDRYLRVIHSRVLSLKRLIQDLFELTRLEQRQISFAFRDVSLGSLVRQVVDKFRLDATNAGLSFLLDNRCPVEVGHLVSVDVDRMDQVFGNLVSNAIRHSHEGGCIKFGVASCTKDEAVLYLEDDGSGISPSDVPFVFERFYKASKARNKVDGGSGLGLAIAKEIMESHGGRIWLESTQGVGSTFYLGLPLPGASSSSRTGQDVPAMAGQALGSTLNG